MWVPVALVLAVSAAADPRPPLLERRFRELAAGYEACFVLYDARQDRTLRVGDAECRRRLSPCSTFKVFNSLAGLQVGCRAARVDAFRVGPHAAAAPGLGAGPRGELPFDRRNVEIVKMLVQDEKDGVVFSGKTGSCDAGGGKRVGWFVGRQASPTADYIFATRIVGVDRNSPRGQGPDGLHAREISRAMLGALPR